MKVRLELLSDGKYWNIWVKQSIINSMTLSEEEILEESTNPRLDLGGIKINLPKSGPVE